MAKKTKERKEKRVTRALGHLQNDVFNALEDQQDSSQSPNQRPNISRRHNDRGDDGGGGWRREAAKGKPAHNSPTPEFGELSAVETIRLPDAEAERRQPQRVLPEEPSLSDGTDAENDDSLARQIDLLRENMAAARRTNAADADRTRGDVEGGEEDDVVKESEDSASYRPFTAPKPLADLSNIQPGTTPFKAAPPRDHLESQERKSMESSAQEISAPPIPSLSLSGLSSSHPHPATPPTMPPEDPYRRYGQAQFVEAEVRLKRALRDQMTSHAEKLSSRMAKLSSSSLEALTKKVENLEGIMASEVDIGASRLRIGGRGGAPPTSSGFSRPFPAVVDDRNASSSGFYRPFSAPLDSMDSRRHREGEPPPSSSVAHGPAFREAFNDDRDSAAHHTADARSLSYDISLALTPHSTSRIAPATAPITPPSGLRGSQGDGAGDGLHVTGRRGSDLPRQRNISTRRLDFERPDSG